MKNEKIIIKNGKRIRIRSEQIHTRKIDRMVVRNLMRKQHRKWNRDTWREYIPEGGENERSKTYKSKSSDLRARTGNDNKGYRTKIQNYRAYRPQLSR